MKVDSEKKYNNYQAIFFIFVISILLSSPLYYKGFFTAHDIHCHMFKLVATVDALLAGQFPPLIGPKLANGFGYSWNIFYAPLSAYIPTLFKIFIPTFTASMKLFIFFTIFLSGITMYYFCQDVSGSRNMSLLASLLYLTAPYRLEDIYIRGAVGEALAFVFIPLFFHGLYSLVYNHGEKDYYITIGYTGLLLSHNISALMAAMAGIIFLLSHIRNLLNTKVLKKLTINGIFIILLSMFYLVPLLEHRLWGDYAVFQPGFMGSLKNMETQSLYPHQLLFMMFNKGELNFNVGLQLLIPLIFIPLVYKRIMDRKIIMVFLFLGLVSVFLIMKAFPWSYMPSFFYYIQFPWRFLMFAVFFLSIPCAYIIQKAYNELEIRQIVPLILIIFVYISPVLAQTANDTKITDQNFTGIDVIGEKRVYSQGSAFFEYMPVRAKADIPYLANREDKVLVTEGEAVISGEVKDRTNLSFDIATASNVAVELPFLYYLGYKISLKSDVGIFYPEVFESEKGFVSFVLPAGVEGSVEVRYLGTIPTRIAYILSFLAFIIFVCYIRLRPSET